MIKYFFCSVEVTVKNQRNDTTMFVRPRNIKKKVSQTKIKLMGRPTLPKYQNIGKR